MNVRQRQFAVTTAEKTTLRTGYIGPCVAFSGKNNDKNIAFMSHVDGNFLGFNSLASKLKELTNEDLEGFSLYITANYTLLLRIIITALFMMNLIFSADKIVPFFALLGVLYLLFGSLVMVYIFALTKFKKPLIKFQLPRQVSGRVTTSISTTSESEPRPSKETLNTEKSQELFGPKQSWWICGLKEVT